MQYFTFMYKIYSVVSWKHQCDCHFEVLGFGLFGFFFLEFGKVISLLKNC